MAAQHQLSREIRRFQEIKAKEKALAVVVAKIKNNNPSLSPSLCRTIAERNMALQQLQ
jgi:hypothetical protein